MTNRYLCMVCRAESYSSSESPDQVCAWCRRRQAWDTHTRQALDLVAPGSETP